MMLLARLMRITNQKAFHTDRQKNKVKSKKLKHISNQFHNKEDKKEDKKKKKPENK